VRPVLQTIVDEALRLCQADAAYFYRRDGDHVILDALAGAPSEGEDVVGRPELIERTPLVALAFRKRRAFHLADVRSEESGLLIAPDESPEAWPKLWPEQTQLSRLAVPVLYEGEAIGVIRVHRTRSGGFSPQQVALVESFAAQAAIAIRHVRLFNETTDALGRQTAVSEVLASISRSAFDLDAVLATIAERAVILARAEAVTIHRRAGDELVVAAFGADAERLGPGGGPRGRVRSDAGVSVPGRAVSHPPAAQRGFGRRSRHAPRSPGRHRRHAARCR